MDKENFSDDEAGGSHAPLSPNPNKHSLDASSSEQQDKRLKVETAKDDKGKGVVELSSDTNSDPVDEFLPEEVSSDVAAYEHNSSNNSSACGGPSEETSSDSAAYEKDFYASNDEAGPSHKSAESVWVQKRGAAMLQIGSWIVDKGVRATFCNDVCIEWMYYDETKCAEAKIRIKWSDVVAIRVEAEDDLHSFLDMEVIDPPAFLIKEEGPLGFCWNPTSDFTKNQASTYRRHYVVFPPGTMEKIYIDHFVRDNQMSYLVSLSFPRLESPYFDDQRHIGVILNPYIFASRDFLMGTVIYIEAKLVEQGEGKGAVDLSPDIGSNMFPVAETARRVAEATLLEREPENSFFADSKLQLDVPKIAMECSACAMVTAMLSLAMGKPVKKDVAISGHVDATGRVFSDTCCDSSKIGHFSTGAQRKGVKILILPSSCQEALDYHVGEERQRELVYHFVDTCSQIYGLAFGDDD